MIIVGDDDDDDSRFCLFVCMFAECQYLWRVRT
jgi:hypothetical protein